MQHSIRLAAGDMGRLKAIAGALGCLGTRQIGIGEPSVSEMMKQVASGDLAITRKERTMNEPHDPDGTYLWRHNTSGERFVVTVAAGHVTAAAGPLHYSEVAAVVEDGFTSDPEMVADIDGDQDNYALVFGGRIRR